MGLLLWIPFVKGNYEYNGMLKPTISTLGTITYETGKIGQAVRIGTGTQVANGVSINTNLVEEFGDEYSCAVWVKPTGDHVHYEGAILSSGDWNRKKWAFGIGQNNTTVDPLGPGYNYKLACEIPVNEWTHLVSTVKNNVATVYKNGELIGTIDFGSLVLESDATNTTIGRESYANGYFSFNGCIQDMRIYNHCLSAEEAKRISQGLVLHYSLSNRGFGGDNLLRNSHVKFDNKSYYVGTYDFADSSKLVTGKTYTLSFNGELQDDSQTGWYFNIFPSPYTAVINNSTEKEGRFAFSFIMPENGGNRTSIGCYSLPIGNRKGCAIWNVKLEDGDHATPWVPNSVDSLYSSLQLDSTTEYDLSGYQYNGIKNGVITSSDTVRNFGCYIFNGIDSYVKCDSNGWMIQGMEEYTVNWWAYSDDWTKVTNGGRMVSCTETGGFNIEGGASGYLRFPRYVYTNVGKTSRAYQYNNSGIKLADLASGWHMFTLIYDLTGEKIYIDGVLHSSGNYTSYGMYFNPNSRLFLGCEANTNLPSAPYFNGKMTDFRLYSTALSADEIADLYDGGGST